MMNVIALVLLALAAASSPAAETPLLELIPAPVESRTENSVEREQRAAQKPRVLPQGVVEIEVANLHCKTCAKRLARKLYATPGVMRVRTYVKQNLAVIQLQPRKQVKLSGLWLAAEAADQHPLELRVLDERLVAKDAEARAQHRRAATHAKPHHGAATKR